MKRKENSVIVIRLEGTNVCDRYCASSHRAHDEKEKKEETCSVMSSRMSRHVKEQMMWNCCCTS